MAAAPVLLIQAAVVTEVEDAHYLVAEIVSLTRQTGIMALDNAKSLAINPYNASRIGPGMAECIEQLISSTAREMWVDMGAAADAAFAEATQIVGRHVEDPERCNMLGQLRHARLEANVRSVARAHGLAVASPHTDPKGGRYSVVSTGGIHIVRGNVQTHRGPPRATKFRRQLASLNRWLSPLQPDFYMTVPEPARDRLCAVLVVTAPRRGNAALPAWIGVGFPHHDLSSWAEIASVGDILARYHDADTAARAPTAVSVEVRDVAVPRLKRDGGRA